MEFALDDPESDTGYDTNVSESELFSQYSQMFLHDHDVTFKDFAQFYNDFDDSSIPSHDNLDLFSDCFTKFDYGIFENPVVTYNLFVELAQLDEVCSSNDDTIATTYTFFPCTYPINQMFSARGLSFEVLCHQLFKNDSHQMYTNDIPNNTYKATSNDLIIETTGPDNPFTHIFFTFFPPLQFTPSMHKMPKGSYSTFPLQAKGNLPFLMAELHHTTGPCIKILIDTE